MRTAIFHSTATYLDHRTGQAVEILRPLTSDEADLDEVGPMFRIRFSDGYETDAFEEELKEEA